ncbi:DNA polymerase alpha/epsilon subunit B-domain-containing protein [Fomitopsis serialis]|uniref:DNA polymerase alpha/epsilon subunit B-domain-containing protein n=1 Tax=Fomitopsis serialis TaxID=139415 RepID=UPI0020077BD1|nr:DNA polymerase alpha/epsilon subunit B-domain-containing protein [Neoantrodia serialis]KAH9936258.1 DNA polymerase alpha/epsilon subunit B-domain-containing protein [Neoantrodia serialis]
MADEAAEKLRTEVMEKFDGTLDEKLVEECVRICRMFNLSGENLKYKWEAMKFGNSLAPFTMNDIPDLKAKCQADLTKANRDKPKTRGTLDGPLSKNLRSPFPKAGQRLGGMMNLATPVKRRDGFAIATMGEGKKGPVAGPSKVKFSGPNVEEESTSIRTYRYMYEKISDRSAALDSRIDDMGELIRLHYNVEDLGDPSATTEEEVVVVGRITLDSETSGGSVKLNEASLTLESSRQMGAGARVPLRFDPNVKIRQGKQGVGGVGLFPGAIAAFRGKNGGGGRFLATEILSLPPLHPTSSGIVKAESTEPFAVCVACGPFTSDADMQYTQWQKLLAKLKSDRPAVVILVGPFIDAAHLAVKNGDVDETPAEIFREQFLANMTDFLGDSPDSQILVVPSVRDIISDHAVFPQGEFKMGLAVDPRIRLLPNPCRFSLNDVTFGVTSVDVLFHLRKEEFFKRAQEVEPVPLADGDATGSDTMINTCRHLLQQRSFYPIFPVPLDLSHEVNLDVTHMERLNLDIDGANTNQAPDVLILPSRLKQFSKVVDSTVVVNPSFLTKGSYASLVCTNPEIGSSLGDRIKAEIVRLEP